MTQVLKYIVILFLLLLTSANADANNHTYLSEYTSIECPQGEIREAQKKCHTNRRSLFDIIADNPSIFNNGCPVGDLQTDLSKAKYLDYCKLKKKYTKSSYFQSLHLLPVTESAILAKKYFLSYYTIGLLRIVI